MLDILMSCLRFKIRLQILVHVQILKFGQTIEMNIIVGYLVQIKWNAIRFFISAELSITIVHFTEDHFLDLVCR